MTLRLVPGPGSRLPQCAARAQTGHQLALEPATALDEQRLVDRLVADPHGLIIGEVDLQPVRDLFRAPRRGPSPVRPAGLVQPLPRRRRRTRRDRAVTTADVPCEPVLHVLTQPVVGHELRGLRSLRRLLRLPLRLPPNPAASDPNSYTLDWDEPGKIDRLDAYRAARSVLSGEATTDPKDASIEPWRALTVMRSRLRGVRSGHCWSTPRVTFGTSTETCPTPNSWPH
ncbi:hypothetical protein BN10_720048 [Phycicoccus elongatus Lp2]|uniref:Uncharacterized protein n=1 Tax=Phycicoccus elongatus Lp2 TaxID=1193181 RepID=N0E625_9MICO|nr:hypothetical protein BN10_720048 [Phycicoccus elongatus Lp2]